jgi:hypothetical protein
MEGTFRIIPKKEQEGRRGDLNRDLDLKDEMAAGVLTGSFHRVQVGGPTKEWLADSGTDRPDAAL